MKTNTTTIQQTTNGLQLFLTIGCLHNYTSSIQCLGQNWTENLKNWSHNLSSNQFGTSVYEIDD